MRKLFVGGSFTNAGGILASNIARWNCPLWSALGSGVAPGLVLKPATVRALAFMGGSLHVGGSFVSAGAKPSYAFAIWHPPGSEAPQASVGILPAGNLVITWNSILNATYQLRSATNVFDPFTAFGTPIPSGGATTRFTNSTTGDASRFFKIEQVLP